MTALPATAAMNRIWTRNEVDSPLTCFYAHETAMKHLSFLRGLILRTWLVRSGNTFFRVFNVISTLTFASPCQFFALITTYPFIPCSETRQFSLRGRRSAI